MSIKSYENFCRAFRSTDDLKYEAELLLTVRDWIIRLGDSVEMDDYDWDLDSLLNVRSYFKEYTEEKWDILSRILDECFEAFRVISGQMRESILRENVKLPIHKVREMNRYGMMWLSRQPGRTIREKASGTNAIMAVRRRMTLDTGENRLFLAFLRQMSDVLEEKLNTFPSSDRIAEEDSMLRQIQAFLRSDALDEVRPWGNLPPNNTLLSDQNYRKIWRGWSNLRQIDDLIEQDDENLPERLCIIFFVELLKALKHYGQIPQLPLQLDYTSYRVGIYTYNRFIPILGKDGIAAMVRRQVDRVAIKIADDTDYVIITRDMISFGADWDLITYPLTKRGVQSCIQDVVIKIFGEIDERPRLNPQLMKFKSAIVDLFALHPRYYVSVNRIEESEGRLLFQEVSVSEEKYELPCDLSQAIYLSERTSCYTVRSALEQADIKKLGRLSHQLEKYLDTKHLSFIFPDVYTNLQVGLLYKAVRMAYPEVRSFPKSIGAAFFWQESRNFKNEFRDGSFLLSIDLIGYDLTFTLVRGNIDPDTSEIIWERHPTSSIPLDEVIQKILNRFEHLGCTESRKLFELFGFDGMRREANRLAFLCGELDSGWDYFRIEQSIFNTTNFFPIDVGDKVRNYLRERRDLIDGAEVFIYSFTPFISTYGLPNVIRTTSDDALYGCKIYQELQAETDTTLWCDYLPKLSIKLLYGEFPLIQQVRVSAQYGERVQIPIDNVFTLPKGKTEYQFDLIQSETSKSTSFIAEVKNPAFPLDEDTKCRLQMWYEYGSENPFTLTFTPCDDNNPAFRQAMVSWRPRSEVKYPVDDLPVPGYPKTRTWDELSTFVGRRNENINIPERVSGVFRTIAAGYYYIDIRDIPHQIMGKPGKRSFTAECPIDGEVIPIEFYEKNIEKIKQKPRIPDFSLMGKISFSIKEEEIDRYETWLSSSFYGSIWSASKQGGYYHYENNWDLDGEPVTIAFFSSEFTRGFNTNVRHVSFELTGYGEDKYGNRKFKAVKICDADYDNGEDIRYIATRIRPGNVPSDRVVNGYCHFLFHNLFFAGRSVLESECPEQLRESFLDAWEAWIDLYHNCTDQTTQAKIFNLMSLAAGDIGDKYYQIANQRIRDYQNDLCKLPDNVGYSLRDCTKQRELELLEHITALHGEKAVCILSKALWSTPEFIQNFPIDVAFTYFDIAVNYTGKLIKQWEKSLAAHYKAEQNLRMCFEYTLGVFRMRQLKDERVKWKLSMNDEAVRKLYGLVEQAIDDKIPVTTFLNLSISEKKQYENIPDLLYVLLVYITGREEGDSIQISGIDFDEE